jgi:hypothetical protein
MNRRIVHSFLFTLVSAAAAWSQSAWLPLQSQFILTPGFAYSTFDEFWVGRDRVDPLEDNDESLDQYTGYVSLEYGILPDLAADVTVGYTATSDTDTFGNDSDNGLADTFFGVRYRVVREQDVVPAVVLRVGGIIAGSYDENTPFSAGDGAHGFEASVLLGKRFGTSGFGAYGDLGYRVRENPVPDDLFGSVGVFKEFVNVFQSSDAITGSVGYRHVQGLSGLDIMGSGFNPALGSSHGFPALREINQLIEGAVGYTDVCGRQYQFTVAKSVDGRNTGNKLVFLFAISVPFGGREE